MIGLTPEATVSPNRDCSHKPLTLTGAETPLLEGRLRYEKFGALVYRLRPTLHLMAVNRTATEILAMCDGKTSIRVMAGQISACHPTIDIGQIERDVLGFLQASIADGVVSC